VVKVRVRIPTHTISQLEHTGFLPECMVSFLSLPWMVGACV
jgi:hypothetical protein